MRASIAVIVASLLVATGTARAARFQVQPTRIDRAGDHHVGSVSITKPSDQAVRFLITAVTWSEDESGAMKLEPTEDLIVYPTQLTIEPGASRAVRVAGTAEPGAHEAPYRI